MVCDETVRARGAGRFRQASEVRRPYEVHCLQPVFHGGAVDGIGQAACAFAMAGYLRKSSVDAWDVGGWQPDLPDDLAA